MLEIQIRNVGKIKEACIELPGITVIAGLNGTGKSTIAKSVFAAVNARKNIAGKIRNDQRQSIEDELEQWLEQNNDFDDIMLFFEAHEELTQHILEAYENEKWEKDDIYEKTEKMDQAKTEVVDVVQNLTAIAEENAAGTEETSASVTEVNDIVEDISGNAKELHDAAQKIEDHMNKFEI